MAAAVSFRWSLWKAGRIFALCIPLFAIALPSGAADPQQVAQSKSRYEKLLAVKPSMLQQCKDEPSGDWPGMPVKRCNYTELNTEAEVALVVPDADRLARWTVTACEDAKAKQVGKCATALEARLWSASNAQFPISGYVVEPRSVLGYPNDKSPRCFLFRSGIAIRTADVTTRAPINGACVPQDAESKPATNAFSFARLASTTRKEFAALPGVETEAQLAGAKFIAVIKREFVAAWSSDRNRLLSAAAISMRKQGLFN